MASRQATYKLVILGESAVGKSSIVLRFVKSQFQEYQEATIGAAYLTQSILVGDPQVTVKFEIWDTAGQERYHSLTPMYYRGAHAAIIVFDITNASSYHRAVDWVNELKEKSPGIKVVALAGNKSDIQDKRAVSTQEAHAYAQDNGLLFMETSAKLATNITELFTAIAESLPYNKQPASNTEAHRLGDMTSNGSSSKCCN